MEACGANFSAEARGGRGAGGGGGAMLVVGAPFTTWFKAVSDMVLVGDLVWTMVVPWTKVRGGACGRASWFGGIHCPS